MVSGGGCLSQTRVPKVHAHARFLCFGIWDLVRSKSHEAGGVPLPGPRGDAVEKCTRSIAPKAAHAAIETRQRRTLEEE